MKIAIMKVDMVSNSPLYIGGMEGLLISDNKALIPGSSLAGAFRSYYESNGGDPVDLFGGYRDNNSIQSKIYFYDSFAEIQGIERRIEIRIDRDYGHAEDGSMREGVYFEKGLEFSSLIEIKDYREEDLDFLKQAIKALDQGIIRLGANKSSGLGVFKVENLHLSLLDLEKKEDLLAYLSKDYSFEDIGEDIRELDLKDNFCEFSLKGRLTSPCLIGAIREFGPGELDSKSIQSGGDYIIPGSSLKGLLRARMERISSLFDTRELVEKAFGDRREKNHLSRIFVSESVIENSLDKAIYNRIHIDRFTGGVSNSALMNDQPVMGDVDFNLIYRPSGDREEDQYLIALIFFALRDLATENIPIGGDSSIGRGRYRARSLEFSYLDEKIYIDFENENIGNKEALDKYIGRLVSRR